MELIYIYFFMLLLLHVSSSAPMSEDKALVSLKASITSDPHSFLSSWNSSTNHCTWAGISCDAHRHVIAINLSSLSLSGSLSNDIVHLPFLQNLSLSHNRLSGPIPELGELRSLKFLDLSNNELTGEIPRSFSELKNLTWMNLFGNKLHGAIPEFIGELPSFKVLKHSENNFTGSVPGTNNETEQPHVKAKIPWSLKALGLIASIIVLIIATCNQARQLKKGSEVQWMLTPLHRLDFTIDNILDCLKEENIIGQEGAGIVYKGVMPNDNQIAIKKLPAPSSESSQDHGFAAEIQTLRKIRHRNIIKLLCFCSNRENNLLVYEYMANGSLCELLHGERGSDLPWNKRYEIAVGVANVLSYLHHDCSPILVHRDLKSSNILLDSDLEARVADFGTAKFLQDSRANESMSRVVGSYGYIAPEYAYTLKIDQKGDVYSFGVLLLELITGRKPTADFGDGVDMVEWVRKTTGSKKEGILRILDPRLPLLPLHEVMPVFHVAMHCVEKRAVKRPTMLEVVGTLAKLRKAGRERPSSSVATTFF